MSKNPLGKSPKKTAFVPRLAYGCVGVGMGVIPLCVASSSACSDPPSVGIRAAYTPDAPSGDDASFVGIIPYIPDAAADNDSPDAGVDGGDGGAIDDASSLDADASGD